MSIRNFDALFRPKSIALIGASNQPHSVGAVIADNLFTSGFKGPVMPVNPHETSIRSTLNYRSVAELPMAPDLAVIATPAQSVPGIIEELGKKGCRAAIVISAGFGEVDSSRELRQAMLDAARPHLMRIVGPNCIGLISPHVGINASFAHLTPQKGDIALLSQSGAIVTAMLDWAAERGIGFSHAISLGDMSDVDFGDLLDYLSTDRATRAIFLYVENITHAKKFMSGARTAARAKPVIVIKSGRSAAGAKAAHSHTGALAGSDVVYDAAFSRAGLLRVSKLEEMFEAAATLATGVRIRGDGLTIVTNGGGAGVMAVDALEAFGGRLSSLDPETIEALDGVLPHNWSRANPVDIIGDAPGERYAETLDKLLSRRNDDATLAIFCPSAITDPHEVAQAIVDVAGRHRGAPVLTNWLGGRSVQSARDLFAENRIATFESPTKAIRAFMHLVRYRRNQENLMETPAAGVAISHHAIAAAHRMIEAVIAAGRTVMTEPEAKELLSLFGIPIVETFRAKTPEEAAARFEAIGHPVALKILSKDITHKSDVGGVRLGLRSADEVRESAEAMLSHIRQSYPDADIEGFTVQRLIDMRDARELIAGIATDATFGPVLLFGRGGKAAEVINDRTIGLPPLNSVLARRMIDRTRVSKLLAGYRDVPAAAPGAIEDVLVRLSEMIVHLPQIVELDMNPFLATGEGVVALDARVAVRPLEHGEGRLAIHPYPREWERVITLKDQRHFLLRPIRPEDETALADMVSRCTPEDLRLRFMGPMKVFPHQTAARFTQIDYDREMAFIATDPGAAYGNGTIYGVVRIISDPENEKAEYAVLVRSDMKGQGLGYGLMRAILAYASKRGLREVYGEVLRENTGMMRMARHLGFDTGRYEPGSETAHVIFDVEKASKWVEAEPDE
ncbi:bifunctional acetate--CoA ligase family protein/GNAT family N-acetyltransferase [Fulvimarina sp. MAC3]